jgi:formylglycine-generating enzyme required for sulfatase activity
MGARDLPGNLKSLLDEAELVLIRPSGSGPGFPAFYIQRSEVTIGMFLRFLKAVGDKPEFWEVAVRRSPRTPGRIPAPEQERKSALRLVDPRMDPELPMTGVTPEMARVYAAWAVEGIEFPAGFPETRSYGLPSLEEWRLAAARALHPSATYPTTGAFPDGSELKDRVCEGARGGAAIGFGKSQLPPRVRSYSPGDFSLYDMAGSAWEWVTGPGGQTMAIGGGHAGPKEECRLDGPVAPVPPTMRRYLGFRLVLTNH